jgi:hypothetical protein
VLFAVLIEFVGAAAEPAPKDDGNPLKSPITFYLAKGGKDACGPGCSEWIAAEGEFDLDSPSRLRALLARTRAPAPPIFFNSGGGLLDQAVSIGRLLRARGMTAGVSKTIPEGCRGASEETCLSLKKGHGPLEAELQSLAHCSSACVYALIGGKVRLVPPGAALGVHSTRLVRIRRSDRQIRIPRPDELSPQEKREAANRQQQIRAYVREMGVDQKLVDIAEQIAHDKVHRLSRTQMAALGIDARPYLETRWMLVEVPSKRPYVAKFISEARGSEPADFRTTVVQFSCAARTRAAIYYLRSLAAGEAGWPMKFVFSIGERNLDLSPSRSPMKLNWLETESAFAFGHDYVPFDVLLSAGDESSIDVQQTDPGMPARPPHRFKISNQGLARSIETLRGRCEKAS